MFFIPKLNVNPADSYDLNVLQQESFVFLSPSPTPSYVDGLATSTAMSQLSTSSAAQTGPVQNNGQSPITQFSDNLLTLEFKIGQVRDGVTLARETAENILSALELFGDVEDGADTVGDLLAGFKSIIKVIGRAGPLKFISDKLVPVFDSLINQVKKIETKAKDIDQKLVSQQDFVQDVINELEGYEFGLNEAEARVMGLRNTIDNANDVYTRLNEPDFADENDPTNIDPLYAPVETAIDTAFLGPNLNFGALNSFLDTVTGNISALNTTFGNVSSLIEGAQTIRNQISQIQTDLGFLEDPLNILNDALSPFVNILDAIAEIVNPVINPIINPILTALGVTTLVDEVEASIIALLPDASIILNLDSVFENIFDDIGFDLNSNLTLPGLGELFDLDLFDTVFATDFLDILAIVGDNPDEVIVVADGEIIGTGTSGNDLISGNEASNTLQGGAGDDLFMPGRGNDVIDGGSGTDTVLFDAPIEQFRFSQLEDGTFIVDHIDPDSSVTYLGVNRIVNAEYYGFSNTGPLMQSVLQGILFATGTASFPGTGGDDFIIGNGENNIISGLSGNDFIIGAGGIDIVFGGAGNDTINAADAGATDPTLHDSVDGGADIDTLSYAGSNNNHIVALIDIIEQLDITLPANAISAADGFILGIENLYGGNGNDTLYGNFGNNVIFGSSGDDLIRGVLGDDLLIGGNGEDKIFGDLGDDRIYGGDDWDLIFPGFGTNIIDGGFGLDTVFYGEIQGVRDLQVHSEIAATLTSINYVAESAISGLPDWIEFDGQTVTQYVSNGASGDVVGSDTLINVTILYATPGNDTLIGTSTDRNIFWGGSGDDIIRPGGTLNADHSPDGFYAGDGDDTVYLSGLGYEFGTGGVGTNTIIYDNDQILTRDYRLTITSSPATAAGLDTLDFSASAHGLTNLRDSAGDATLSTLTFRDTQGVDSTLRILDVEFLIGTDHADEIYFSEDFGDSVLPGINQFNAGGGDDLIYALNNDPMLVFGEDGDDYIQIGRGIALGGEGNDVLIGTRGPKESFGLVTLEGNGGDDLVFANSGDGSIYRGGAGNDTLSFTKAPSYPTINLNTISLLDGTARFANFNDTVVYYEYQHEGFENVIGTFDNDIVQGSDTSNIILTLGGLDTIYGNGGNDLLFGGASSDTIYGGIGDDVISVGQPPISIGSSSNDVVSGGAGSDTLSFEYMAELSSAPDFVDWGQFTVGMDGSVIVTMGEGTATQTFFSNSSVQVSVNFTGIENIVGTQYGDVLSGDFQDNVITGDAGDDVLSGFSGNDTLIAGDGADTLNGGLGQDALVAGRGDMSYDGGDGTDTLNIAVADQGGIVNLSTGTVSLNYTTTSYVWADGTTGPKTINHQDNLGNSTSTILTAEQAYRTSLVNFKTQADLERYIDGNLPDIIEADNSGLFALDVNGELGSYTPGLYEVTEIESIQSNTSALTNIENIDGSRGNDILTGSALGNVINGGAGDDIINGGGGTFAVGNSDSLNGGDGDDLIIETYLLEGDFADGGDGIDTFSYDELGFSLTYDMATGVTLADGAFNSTAINFENARGSNLNDQISGTEFANEIWGREGDDTLEGRGGDDSLFGGLGDDSLSGGQGNDSVDGGDGIDTLILSGNFADYSLTDNGDGTFTITDNVGSNGVDRLTSIEFIQYADNLLAFGVTNNNGVIDLTNADDVFYGSPSDEIIGGLDGSDLISASAGHDIINGNNGNDYLRGDMGNDELYGGFGVDYLRGGPGADIINGGAGSDWADYSTSSIGVTVNLLTNVNSGGDAQGDTITLTPRVLGSTKDDHITGDAGVNYLRGWSGDDVIHGGDGNDYIQGDAGADDLYGDNGLDWAYYVSSDVGVHVSLLDNIGKFGHAEGDTYTSIEYVYGSPYVDHIIGDTGTNFLRGHDSDDLLEGGDGDDFLRGDAGADFLDGGNGNDWVYYATADSAVTVDLTAGTGSGSEAQGDTYISIERVFGSTHADFILGDTGSNYLRGYFGSDNLFGGDGNDFLQGDAGADALDGGAGSDWAYYVSSQTGLTLNLSNSSLNTGEAAGDIYTSIENIVGSRLNDNITGDGNDNYLRGYLGDDVINGGAGNDILRGEAGADTFVFEVGTGNDTVIDYNDVEDLVDLSDFDFDDEAHALSMAADVNGDVVFSIGTDIITIENTTLSEISDNLIL